MSWEIYKFSQKAEVEAACMRLPASRHREQARLWELLRQWEESWFDLHYHDGAYSLQFSQEERIKGIADPRHPSQMAATKAANEEIVRFVEKLAAWGLIASPQAPAPEGTP